MAASRPLRGNAPARPEAEQPRSLRSIALSLALALGIVAGAWAIGGRQGFDSIGSGGANLKLLPKVGEPAPPFQALALTGEVVDSGEFAGVPLWINFWGSWCAPCRAELPEMKAAWEVLEPRGLVIAAISLDEPTIAAALYASQNDVEFLVLSDPNRTGTSSTYSINNFPTHIFVDADGIVRAVVLAQMSLDEAVANAELAINPTG